MIPYKEARRIILKGGQEKIDIRWRLNVSSSEVRVRKDFETQADAIKYAAAIKTVKKRAGVSAVMTIARLPDRTLVDVVTALDLAATLFPNQTISFAEMIRKAATVTAEVPQFEHRKLAAALEAYLGEIRGQIDPTWHRTLGGCLKKIAKCLGDLDVHEITADLLEDAFEEQTWASKTTWNHHRAYYITFLKWAAKKSTKKKAYIIGNNPAEEVPMKIKNRDELEDIAIPPSSYRAALIETARAHPALDMETYLALTFDLGLRTAEALRLVWADHNPEENDPDLKVSASKAKSATTRTLSLRHPLLRRAKQVLGRHSKASGYIVPRNLRERRDELCRLAGVTWIQGVGRKCFATYFYRHTGDDVLTRSILGHLGDATIFINNYRAADVIENGIRRRVTSCDAETYFGISISTSRLLSPTVA